MRAEQTVSEMVVEILARQTESLSEREGRPFEDAFVEVLDTPAGRLLTELVDGPHRNERAAEWQAHLIADRLSQRPATLLGGRARRRAAMVRKGRRCKRASCWSRTTKISGPLSRGC